MAKITERGWVGHYILADRCLFRRNTLIEGDKDSVIVSTVGNLRNKIEKGIESIGGNNRYYETRVFGVKNCGTYKDVDVSDERSFEGKWSICADDYMCLPVGVDNEANDMHDAVIAKFAQSVMLAENA